MLWPDTVLLADAHGALTRREIFSISSETAIIRGLRFRNPGKPPVVLLHGIFSDNSIWDRFAAELWETGFDVWVPNMRGQGQGPLRTSFILGTGGYDYSVVEDVPNLMTYIYSQTQQKINLVGFSFGGMLGKQYVSGVTRGVDGKMGVDQNIKAQRTLETASLTLIATPLNPFNWPQPLRGIGPTLSKIALMTGMTFSLSITRDILEDTIRDNIQGYKSRDGFDYDLSQQGYDHIPTLIVVGEKDILASKKDSIEEAQEINANFKLVEVKGTNHATFFLKQAPLILAARVAEFIKAPEIYRAPVRPVEKYFFDLNKDRNLEALAKFWKTAN